MAVRQSVVVDIRVAERRRLDLVGEAPRRPTTRADCANVPRPCPYVGCEHHLYLDVNPNTGRLYLNFPDKEPGDLKDSCALDVADRERDGLTHLAVASRLNVTMARVRQIEWAALRKLAGMER